MLEKQIKQPQVTDEIVEDLVNYVDQQDNRGVSSTQAARGTGISLSLVRRVFHELESLNIMCRTGIKRGTHWWLA